jgi:hypothetical protein
MLLIKLRAASHELRANKTISMERQAFVLAHQRFIHGGTGVLAVIG